MRFALPDEPARRPGLVAYESSFPGQNASPARSAGRTIWQAEEAQRRGLDICRAEPRVTAKSRARAVHPPSSGRSGTSVDAKVASTTHALRTNDAFFRHIVSGMRNGVLAITRDGRLALINDEAYRIF